MININKRAIVIGGTNIDIIRCSDRQFIEFNPNSNKITSSVGGGCQNVCENLSRMGINTMLISAINNNNSKELIQQCVRVGIDCEGILVSDMEIAQVITPEHISKFASHLDNGDVIFMDTNLSRETIEYVLKNWGDHIPIFIDTISIANATKLKGITQNIYCLKPNLEEAIAITGEQDLARSAVKLIQMGIDKVMLSIDSMGILCASKGEMVLYPSKNQNFANHNGVGDAFMAGAIFGYLNSNDNFSMVSYGFAAATIALSSRYSVSPNINFDNLTKQVRAYAV